MRRDFIEKIFVNRRRSSALRMAPMIDMIFLLLIFFLVAGKWRPAEDFLPFKLPTAEAGEYSIGGAEPLLIYIADTENGCRIQVGQQYTIEIREESIEADLVVLMERMREILVEEKRFKSDPVEIVCDESVKWDYVAKIYNLFYGAGLTDITFQMTE